MKFITRNQSAPIFIFLLTLLIIGCSQPTQELILSPTNTQPSIINTSAPSNTPIPTLTPSPQPTNTPIPIPEGVPNSHLPKQIDFEGLLSECENDVAKGIAEFRYVEFLPGATYQDFVESIGADCYQRSNRVDPATAAWIGVGSFEGWNRDSKNKIFDTSYVEPGPHMVWIRNKVGENESGSSLFKILDDLPSNPETINQHPPPWIPLETVTLVSYNVFLPSKLCTDSWYHHLSNERGNLSLIKEIITAPNPDIVLLQEWCPNRDDETRQFAASIGLPNYFIGEDFFNGGYIPTAIFTKQNFQLVFTESLRFSDGPEIAENIFRGLYAEVVTPNGNTLSIFNVHLNPFCGQTDYNATTCPYKDAQVEWLVEYIGDTPNAIITGDMNFPIYYEEAETLRTNGWTPLTEGNSTVHKWVLMRGLPNEEYGRRYIIDHAWIRKGSHLRFLNINENGAEVLEPLADTFQEASDHNPNYFVIEIYPQE